MLPSVDSMLNISIGSSLIFFSAGYFHSLKNKECLDTCSRTNLSLGCIMSSLAGSLYICKGFKN